MYSRQDVIIKTKITDRETIRRITDPIVDFANRLHANFEIGVTAENQLIASYDISGKTSAYCKGVIAEIKQRLKDVFECKIEVTFYVY